MIKRIFSPLSPLGFVVFLTALYFVVVTIVPFEAIDRSLARLIFHYGEEGWNHAFLWAGPLYSGAKWFTGIILAVVLWFAYRAYRADDKPLADALLRVVLSAVTALLFMVAMKSFSGVACPWSLPEFSQHTSQVITPFSWFFNHTEPQGRCWPAGHASTGFCLFGLYFAARQLHVKHANWVLGAVLAYGGLCATGRMLQGAHFLSHSVATLLLEFVVTGLFFLPDSKEKSTISISGAAFGASVTLTLLAIPFFSEVVSTPSAHSFLAMVASALLFAMLWQGLFLLLVRLMPRLGWRVVLAAFGLIGAGADAFTTLYGTVMTPDMVRNALATDWHEATELLSMNLVLRMSLFALPALAVACLAPRVENRSAVDFTGRLIYVTKSVLTFVVVSAFLLSQFSTLSAFMRNHKNARYLIEPPAIMYSFVRTLTTDSSPDSTSRTVIDPNPTLTATSDRPLLVVLVVGETVRASNWGLNGYQRNTTPQLAKRSVTNFTQVTSCGTSTDVSLPCMFSRVGRENYDRDRILSEESVLSVLERAGISVHWVDNQSGCKGACTNTMLETVVQNSTDCPSGTCYDGAMLGNIKAALNRPSKRELLVLHTMGNHGPAYWRRTPNNWRPFGTGCLKDDLGECPRQDVVTSYDNAVAYTDQFLADAIDLLSADTSRDTVLLYVSDHGESLGENGLWLHGAPYWLQLDDQTKVPMVLWMNPSAKERFQVSLPSSETTPVSHDYLASTLCSLMDVKTSLYTPQRDLLKLFKHSR